MITSTFDVIVIAAIGLLTIVGFWNGMVKQIFGLLGIVAGYVLGMKFYLPCSKFLTGLHPGTAKAISFIAILLACIIVAHLIGWAVERLFSISKLGFLNRIGGGLLGFLKGCILVSIVVMVLTAFLPADHSLLRKSSTITHIRSFTSMLKKFTRGDIKAKYNEKTGTEESRPAKRK